jgi:hypothetical protein
MQDMTNKPGACESCPRVTEARVLHPVQPGVGYCFECPQGYVPAGFAALAHRLEGRRLNVHSCRREPAHAG